MKQSELKIDLSARFINSMYIRTTDCNLTFDFMLKQIDIAIDHVKNFTSLEFFNLLIKLDDNGLKNIRDYIFQHWNKSEINIWDIRQIESTLKYLIKKSNGKS
jgi:hypothetical protein